ncbi:hypothetical protein [Sphingobium cupriresistens]|uniref:Uncharacterized protein n=1 Tax=Sphingobium cupriresistens TaxID=1132417 RepID=A0A8G1ZHH7_9SPHN|nr:hypothetical protein [Sphingobium cupriresistens]RYM11020.1 hypothetical protein EWH12_09950 [Sphingobium cupriresistens]
MPDRIIIAKAAIGGRHIVTFEPRSISWPSLEFRTHDEAVRCAEARQKVHGWLIEDKTGEVRDHD